MARRKKPDIKQMRLTVNPKTEVVSAEMLFPDEYSCPYCLFTATISKFLIALEKGYSEKRMECPDCGQRMLARTLTMDLKPAAYAEWLYMSLLSQGGYERISWKKLVQRLKEKGIAKPFWERWKEVRKPKEDEQYGEYLEAEKG